VADVNVIPGGDAPSTSLTTRWGCRRRGTAGSVPIGRCGRRSAGAEWFACEDYDGGTWQFSAHELVEGPSAGSLNE
jgi:hypothetical protein